MILSSLVNSFRVTGLWPINWLAIKVDIHAPWTVFCFLKEINNGASVMDQSLV